MQLACVLAKNHWGLCMLYCVKVGSTAVCKDVRLALNLDVSGWKSNCGRSEITRGCVVGLFDLGLRLQCSLNRPDRRGGHLPS